MTHAPARPATVLPLTAVGRDDLAAAGGKGANLGELVRAGFPVPDGVVITTDAYAAVVEHAGLAAAVAAAAEDDGAALRAAFAAAEIPDDLRGAILGAYALLGNGPVAVRSSATAEDLPGAAFAGQQDTYLNIVGADALLDAVRRCWGSLWTERAIAYRARRDVDPAGVRIAVVVQRMVPAAFAGVLFTANPVSGDRTEVVVDASSGLGEAVVSGLVTPDHYVLDADGRVRERRRGLREIVVRGVAGGGVEHRRGEALTELPDAVLAELAALGRRVAAHFGRPQDIEWAWADGRVWLVQARPMTALPPPPLRLSRIQRITGPQIVEYLPVRPYPMDTSGWIARGIGRMVQRMLAEIPGLHVDFADVLPESDGVVDRYVPPRPRPTWKVLTAPARNLPRIRRYHPAGWTRDPRFVRFDREARELAALDVRGLGWAELRRLPQRTFDVVDVVTDLRVDYLPRVAVDLLRLRVLQALLGRRDVSGLTLGTHTRTEDANRELLGLAERVRADGALRAVFGLEPDALAERIEQDPAFADFRAALSAFRAEYGHRETASPLLMSAPTWGDAPATVLGMVKVLLEDAPPAQAADRAEQAERQLLAHPLVRLTRSERRVRRLLADARAGIAFREDSHFHGTRTLPVLRRAVLEAGRRLAEAGVLREADDVLHLRLEELESLGDPATLPPADAERIRAAVRARSARRAELAGVPLIAPSVLFPGGAAGGDALVTGTGASGGRATGPVRVIREAAEFGRLRSGEVLVCPYTNPSWTPLFQRAAAVVVDTGGIGSHAAIVAREYGIPAVMGSATGTSVLTDGQVVTVDGDTGRVTGD
ncbi:pyruvate,water dikinase [Pseudonocardia hierapolitana]|uniref:Pyruvate,water dikinase n=1 Tax=Pseudonocardia hierapolitana TaxID=1128676 RepID=A0A561SVG6_9PSEU|nr:PEP/pyruvate-binding domain-containing protein [Pseudonocardia hierapolitana]TWF78860.1 pyruvate,water dikinase [Pseudonocardia hierapolitana]